MMVFSGFLAARRSSTKEGRSPERDEQYEGSQTLLGDAWMGEVYDDHYNHHHNHDHTDHDHHADNDQHMMILGRRRGLHWKVGSHLPISLIQPGAPSSGRWFGGSPS